MQTFLPYDDFHKTAQVLDRARLGKQRVETLQIMKSMLNSNHGWRHHPAIKMWQGYGWALLQYQYAICNEWTNRGYKDTCLEKTKQLYSQLPPHLQNYGVFPAWLGNNKFHQSHRSNLTRKNKIHYGIFWFERNDLDYVWPV